MRELVRFLLIWISKSCLPDHRLDAAAS